jgi:hypothetical protein
MSLKARIARLEKLLPPVEPPAEKVVRDFTEEELACYCGPTTPCHGDALIAMANA